MANIPDEIPEIWLNPPEDYISKNIYQLEVYDPVSALIYKFRSLAHRIGAITGYMKIIEIVQNKAYLYYKDGDWRWKNAVLMIVSVFSKEL